MTLDEFARAVDLYDQTEIERARLLAYYYVATTGAEDFTSREIAEWFAKLNLPEPNTSRLKNRLQKSTSFLRSQRRNAFRLHGRDLQELSDRYPDVTEPSEEIVSSDTVLPKSLYESTRGYIESLARQINASYEHNVFDGCAVLMRRLLEILLILSYQHLGISDDIKNTAGDYVMLEAIISNAQGHQMLRLSRNSRSSLDDFRTLGNFSAHKIYYNARRSDVKKVIIEYRALIEELLYKSGIRT